MNITEWYSFFWAIDVLLGASVLILLSIHNKYISAQIEKARVDLLDKLHFAMSQSVKRSMA